MKYFNSVLLVDDDEISNFISEKVLKKFDFADFISTSQNGKYAYDFLIDIFKNNQGLLPTLIFLDINMPVMDGFELLNRLSTSNHNNDIKVIMLTSSINDKDKEKALEYNCVIGYMEKPLTVEKMQPFLNNNFSKIAIKDQLGQE